MEEKINQVHVDAPAKKRINWKKVVLVVGIVISIIAIYFLVKVIFLNKTELTTNSIKIDYSLELEDGTIISQNVSTFKAGKIGSSLGLNTDKLDNEVSKMKEGQSKEIILTPEEAFGEYNESFVVTINRTEVLKREQELNRTMEISIAQFRQTFDADPEIGKSYSLQDAPWNYTVISVNSTDVTFSNDAKEGMKVPVNDIYSFEVKRITSDKIILIYEVKEQMQELPYGNLSITMDEENIYFKFTPHKKGERIIFGFMPALVVDYNETSIVLDYNMPHAGKTIIAKIKVLEIEKKEISVQTGSAIKKIEGAPTLQTFVMTHCPFGIQMEKGILPVYKLLKNKANFEIRFVSYFMHGDKEKDETYRQICIREEHSEKFWQYLECFLEDGDSERCLSETGLSKSAIAKCMTERAEDYFEEDKKLNEKYSIRGSPTNVLDDEVKEIYPRSPENVKNVVCSAFYSKPSECSEKLSSDNPSPGFGYKTIGSSASGGCGSA
ncbi:MAG: FKBP-type peptidyl-prolyl cis-trans isomerase [Candidatus Pacearchaeota archaeon]